jgi:hypothetical protein
MLIQMQEAMEYRFQFDEFPGTLGGSTVAKKTCIWAFGEDEKLASQIFPWLILWRHQFSSKQSRRSYSKCYYQRESLYNTRYYVYPRLQNVG